MSDKRHLLTPGPTPVPPEVLAAISQPVVHHRGPDFKPVYERTLVRLRAVFRTERDVLLFGAAGTGAMESAVANLCSPGERVLVVSAGHFGERWQASRRRTESSSRHSSTPGAKSRRPTTSLRGSRSSAARRLCS